MKQSTLSTISKSLKILPEVASQIRGGCSYLIKPLMGKNIMSADDYYYFKEYRNGAFTTKKNSETFVRVVSNKVVNVQELTMDDYVNLGIYSQEEFIKYYNNIVMLMTNHMVEKSAKKLVRTYCYENNPCIELVEVEIVTADIE